MQPQKAQLFNTEGFFITIGFKGMRYGKGFKAYAKKVNKAKTVSKQAM